MAGGYLLRKSGKVSSSTSAGINAWVLYLALPAVILKAVPQIRWTTDALFPLAAPLIVLGGAWLFTRLAARPLHWDRGERTALFLSTGLANTSFVGFPLILAFYGPGFLPIGVLRDQVTFILLSTVGIAAASLAASAGQGVVAVTVLKRLVSFPPLLTFLAALILPQFVDLAPLHPLFDAIGGTLAPLALFSVGLQLSFSQAAKGGRTLLVGLSYKLLVAPALVFGVALLLGIKGPSAQIAIFEAAMAPMITSAVIASEYKTAPHLANALVGIGIPVSFITVTLWWFLLRFF